MPLKGRGAAAARDLAAQEAFHAERPLLCVATDVRHEALLCRGCLAPLGLPADHVRAAAPELLDCEEELRSALEDPKAQRLCAAEGGSCGCCGARFCSGCVGAAQATHACAGTVALRERWPKLAAAPRFRLFVQALSLVTQVGDHAAAAAAAIDTLCRPALPADDNAAATAAWEAEMAEPLAVLHCALARERLERARPPETAVQTSAALALISEWCSVRGYRGFERRVATNAHGLRFASPASDVLVAAMAAAPSLSPAAQEAVCWAVAGVGEETQLPFYVATAVCAQGSACNHSCDPSAEVLASTWPELRLRTTRALRRGEELTIAYVSRQQRSLHVAPGKEGVGAAVRAELLERYGFVCGCELCARASDASS